MKTRKVFNFKKNWPEKSANLIYFKLTKLLNKKNDKKINILLTGGNSIIPFYKILSSKIDNLDLSNFNFFLSDERMNLGDKFNCSNHYILEKNFFSNLKKNKKINFFPLSKDSKKNINYYYLYKFPQKIDISILSIGIDGHVASIFPNHKIYGNKYLPIFFSKSSQHSFQRLSLKPKILENSDDILTFALGKKKEMKYFLTQYSNLNKEYLPAKFLARSSWIFGS